MEDIINFLHQIEKLKTLKRAGWVLRKVPEPESVADHTFRVAIMALLLAEKAGVNKDKCVKMALVHDLAEISAGDITPHDNIIEEDKKKIETKAMEKLLKKLDNKELLEVWKEFADRKTPEARFVYEIDKLEMALQASEYEKRNPNLDLDEFWPFVEERISDENIKKLFMILKTKRKE